MTTTEAERSRKILIDASSVTARADGLSTYIVQLIRHLPAAAQGDFDFTLLVNPDLEREDLRDAIADGNMRVLETPVAAIGPRRDWHMLRLMRRLRAEFGLIHITAMTYPLAMRGGVCTIHDLTYRRWLDDRPGLPGSAHAARLYLDANIRHCVAHAQAIIAVSEATKQDIARLAGVAPEALTKAVVIHEGWEHMASRQSQDRDDRIGGLPTGNYLFFLGSHRLHKNLDALVQGFDKALDRIPADKQLVITGTSDRLSAALRLRVDAINRDRSRIVFTGHVSDAAVAELYRRADAFVFPSLAEGFGLPVLEAFYHKVPLLAANAPALPEVAGEAALYFDPRDTSDIADKIVRFYADPTIRPALIAAGTERLAHFSWAKAARETVDLYRNVLGGLSAAQ